MPLYPPENHPEKPHREAVDGHYHLLNSMPVNLDCIAEDCVHFDGEVRPEENCKRGYNGSLVVHVWGFCKYYESRSDITGANNRI